MKPVFAIIIFVVGSISAGWAENHEPDSSDRDYSVIECATELVLELKVRSASPVDDEAGQKISDMLNRRLDGERMLWSVVQVRTRVYASELTRSYLSPTDYTPLRDYPGITALFNQAQREAHRRLYWYMRDPFEAFFDYTPVGAFSTYRKSEHPYNFNFVKPPYFRR